MERCRCTAYKPPINAVVDLESQQAAVDHFSAEVLPCKSVCMCVCVNALDTSRKLHLHTLHCRSITLYPMYIKHRFIVCLLKQCLLDLLSGSLRVLCVYMFLYNITFICLSYTSTNKKECWLIFPSWRKTEWAQVWANRFSVHNIHCAVHTKHLLPSMICKTLNFLNCYLMDWY